MRFYFYLLLCPFLFLGCNRIQNKEEYLAWYGKIENGFVKSKTINGIDFVVYCHVPDYQIVRDLDPEIEYTKSAIDSIRNSEYNSLTFILEIDFPKDFITRSSRNQKDFLEMAEKMSFGMEKQVVLKSKNKEIYPVLFHHERGYELTQKEKFLFTFPISEIDPDEDFTFSYNDIFFNSSVINFTYNLRKASIPEMPIKIKES